MGKLVAAALLSQSQVKAKLAAAVAKAQSAADIAATAAKKANDFVKKQTAIHATAVSHFDSAEKRLAAAKIADASAASTKSRAASVAAHKSFREAAIADSAHGFIHWSSLPTGIPIPSDSVVYYLSNQPFTIKVKVLYPKKKKKKKKFFTPKKKKKKKKKKK